MTTKTRVIAIDFDDVIFDLNGSFRPWHNQTFGTAVQAEDITDYCLHEIYNTDQEGINERFYRFYKTREHEETNIIAGAREAISILKTTLDLQIVTSRYDLYKTETLTWLERHFPNTFSAVHFTNHYATDRKSKSEVCLMIGAECLIDDAAHHVEEVTKNGVPALLLDKTWNQTTDIGEAVRVNDWNHALSHLKQIGLLE